MMQQKPKPEIDKTMFNQFSYLWIMTFVGLVLGGVLWRWQQGPAGLRISVLVAYVVVALIVTLIFRYPSTTAESVATVEATLNGDRPTFIMLYSNF
jgi:hypothetical protein